MKLFYFILFVALSSISLPSCGDKGEKDISKVSVDVRYDDLHLDLAQIDTNDIVGSIANLQTKYGDFLSFFLYEIAALDTSGSYSDSMVRLFFTYKDLRDLHDTVAEVYKDTKDIQKDLTKLFKYIKVNDSSITIPSHVVFYTSGLHHVAFTYQDSILGIGLDRFFGSEFLPYELVDYPNYVTRTLVKENIPIEAAKTIFNNKYGISIENKNMLELMIHEGKQLYFLHHVLPDVSDDRLLGYTKEELKWCEENEVFIYKFFTDQNLFYEKTPIKIMRYIAPTPTSMGMPEKSPGKTGAYIGYQIVKAYQEKKNKSLYDLLNNTSVQDIFNQAKYKPKR